MATFDEGTDNGAYLKNRALLGATAFFLHDVMTDKKVRDCSYNESCVVFEGDEENSTGDLRAEKTLSATDLALSPAEKGDSSSALLV